MRKANSNFSITFCLAAVVILLYWISLPLSGDISPKERAALIALYNSTKGENWTNKSGWKTPPLDVDGFAMPGTENTWKGIKCDPGNTTVKQIFLYNNNLNGAIPPELGNLANLQDLELSWNQLSGSIPKELGNLANLQYLSLHSNQLSGSIPKKLGTLKNLQRLYLDSNQLSGSIPKELETLDNLQYLHLSQNKLSGSIPPELGNLANLQTLGLSSNKLSGSIPTELGNLANLQALALLSNQLSGSIPLELGNLDNLQRLYLDSNQLSGSIPPELGNLANLQALGLSSNQLSGSIPPKLGNLANLRDLWLSSNKLIGNIPEDLTKLTNLWADWSNIRWNALYTNNEALRTFLNSKQVGGNWESTQTIAPTDVDAKSVSHTSINIQWTPIICTGNTGGYSVLYSTTQGGPYTYFGKTANKSAFSLTVTGLNPSTTYYFVVQTRTDSHAYNQNRVDSEYSAEVSAETPKTGLTLTSPNGGEKWGIGTNQNITWISSGLPGNLRIELWKTNKNIGNIAVNIPIGNGKYTWQVGTLSLGAASISGTDFRVKIITANGLYSDTSDGDFSIVNPSLKLTSPLGGENWQRGTQHNITWTSEGLTGNVKLILLKDGKGVGTIAQGIPIINRTYAWTVGKYSAGSKYTVKIIPDGNNLFQRTSKTFSI